MKLPTELPKENKHKISRRNLSTAPLRYFPPKFDPPRDFFLPKSVAPARPDDHVLVLLVQDRPRVVKVQDRDGVQVDGRAAGVGQRRLMVAVAMVRRGIFPDEVDKGLHYGVVGGVHVVLEGKRAEALASERRVVGRRHDPILKINY